MQPNKANTSDTEAPFWITYLFNGFISSKIYDKVDDFDFDIVNFPFLDGDVPRRPSYEVYIRFTRVCSNVDDFNTRDTCWTAKLLKQGYRDNKLREALLKFYRRHNKIVSNSLLTVTKWWFWCGSLLPVLLSEFRCCFISCLFIIFLVRFGLLSGHLFGNNCPRG